MRIVFVCFPIIGFQMVATNFFMSIGMAGKAIFLSLSRQLLFLMPGLIFLPHILRRPYPLERQLGRVVRDAAVGPDGVGRSLLHAGIPIAKIPGADGCGRSTNLQ